MRERVRVRERESQRKERERVNERRLPMGRTLVPVYTFKCLSIIREFIVYIHRAYKTQVNWRTPDYLYRHRYLNSQVNTGISAYFGPKF